MREQETTKYEYKHSSLKAIEESRIAFLKYYKKHDFLKKIVFVIGTLGMLFFLLFFQGLFPNLSAGVSIGLAIACVVLMLVYSTIVKKVINLKMSDYFKTFYRCTNEYTLSNNSAISDVILEEPGKISKEEFIENGIYKDIFEVGSRGLTSFKYKKMKAKVCDCAGQVRGDKKVTPAFVGKYLTSAAKYDGEKPIILYVKGKELPLPPTNIIDKKPVLNDDKMVIYTNFTNWKKVLTPKIMKKIDELKTNKLFVDFTICLKNKKQYVCMGYNDPLMIPPLENAFNPNPTMQYKKDLEKVLEIMEALQ